jgi:solute carrier family 44 (choline transporter-like protein), member 2/4/5
MNDYKVIVNDELRDGPIRTRRCTDLAFCIIFVMFLLSMVAIGTVGFIKGNPSLLLYPYDSSGNQCGKPDSVLSSYKYLYYPTAATNTNVSLYRVCMEDCPVSNTSTLNCYSNNEVTCSPGSKYFYLPAAGINAPPYDSDPLLKRFCVPYSTAGYLNSVLDYIYESGLDSWISDIYRCWTAILIVSGIACGISIAYLILIRYCAEMVTWISIISTGIIIITFGIYIDKVADEQYSNTTQKKTHDALKIAAIVIYCFIGLFVIIIVFLYRRIHLAIAIMKSGAIFINDMPSIFLVPIGIFVFSCIFFGYWVLALIFIYSSGDLEKTNSVVARISWDDTTRNSLYFEAVGIIWISSMKIAVTQFIVSCCVCFWYFSREESSAAAICKSIYYVFRYHLGTLAFGSLILSVIKVIKYLLWYLSEKIYKKGFEGNKCFKFCCTCVECYADCFARFIQFLDKHAYIQTALSGLGFCEAAKNAYALILENAIRFASLGAIGDIFKIIGKIFITCASTYSGFLIISYTDYYRNTIQSPIPPTCVFGLVSYILSGVFMTVLEMACDTIIQAFLIDEKIHQDPFFAPEPLKEFIKLHREVEHKSVCCGCL